MDHKILLGFSSLLYLIPVISFGHAETLQTEEQIISINNDSVISDEVEVTKIDDCVVDPKALTIYGGIGPSINGQAFQQNALMSFKGYQYVTWYNANRQVCLGRRRLPAGKWETVTFADYVFGEDNEPWYRAHDSHNTISIGICPADGTIHLSWDHHMHPLNYRVSKKGVATQPEKTKWENELFGPVLHELQKGQPLRITYPRFIITPDGSLQFFYRWGPRPTSAQPRVLHTYDPDTGKWSGPRPIIAENGYTNYNSRYGKDGRLHLMWHWRTTGRLCYIYTVDQGKTWKNNLGTTVLTADDEKPLSQSDMEKVSAIKPKNAPRIMLGGQYMDSKSRPHEIVWHIPDNSIPRKFDERLAEDVWKRDQSRYHHYWRDDEGEWQDNILPIPVGTRAKILLDTEDNAYVITMLNKSDQWDWPLTINRGELVIASASAGNKWTDWKVVSREPGPFQNEVLFDNNRWESDGVLSVFVQDSRTKPIDPPPPRIIGGSAEENQAHISRLLEIWEEPLEATPLRILEFQIDRVDTNQ